MSPIADLLLASSSGVELRLVRAFAGVLLADATTRHLVVASLLEAAGGDLAHLVADARERFAFGSAEWSACWALGYTAHGAGAPS